MSSNNEFLSIDEICKKIVSKKIVLPTIQRGFVWNSAQIENLWDSLMRGLPIGSFILSKSENNKMFLLDGQQRASSLLLGLKDGEKDFHELNINEKDYAFFLCLERPESSKLKGHRKFIFRVINRSHPWGYQKVDNTKRLTMNNIAKAKKVFGTKYENLFKNKEDDLEGFWPHDATCPVPLHFFNSTDDYSIFRPKLDAYLKDMRRELANFNDEAQKFFCSLEENEIKKIFDEYQIMRKKTTIPVQCPLNIFESEISNEILADVLQMVNVTKVKQLEEKNVENSEELEKVDDQVNSSDADEIETLFIRLNSAGTPLRGEELNYSMLKGQIDGDSISLKKMEEFCGKLIRPSRLLSIGFRLYQYYRAHEVKQDSSEFSKSLIVKPKDFQRYLSHSKDLIDFLGTTFLESLKEVRRVLLYNNETNKVGLPPILFSNLFDSSPEMAFLILYRVLISKDYFILNNVTHRRMLGLITTFSWFSRGGRARKREKILSNIWPLIDFLNTAEKFWSDDLYIRAKINNGDEAPFTILPSINVVEESFGILLDNVAKDESAIRQILFKTPEIPGFLKNLYERRELVLFAQRSALDDEILEAQWHLDDTNIPYDWDHIAPQEMSNRVTGLREDIKYWYSSIGNYRAWPFSLNRQDQSDEPFVKFSQNKYRSTAKEYMKDQNVDISLVKRDNRLMANSFCNKDWFDFDIRKTSLDKNKNGKIRAAKVQKKLLGLFFSRTLDLYKNWLEEYKLISIIDNIFSEKTGNEDIYDSLCSIFILGTFKRETVYGDDFLSMPISDTNLYFTVFTQAKNLDELLTEENIELCIWNKNEKDAKEPIWSNFVFSNTEEINDVDPSGSGITKDLTLLGNRDKYWHKIINEFCDWVRSACSEDLGNTLQNSMNSRLRLRSGS